MVPVREVKLPAVAVIVAPVRDTKVPVVAATVVPVIVAPEMRVVNTPLTPVIFVNCPASPVIVLPLTEEVKTADT